MLGLLRNREVESHHSRFGGANTRGYCEEAPSMGLANQNNIAIMLIHYQHQCIVSAVARGRYGDAHRTDSGDFETVSPSRRTGEGCGRRHVVGLCSSSRQRLSAPYEGCLLVGR